MKNTINTIEKFESFKIEGNDVKGGFTISSKMTVSGNKLSIGGMLGKTGYNYQFTIPNNIIGSAMRWVALLFGNRGLAFNFGEANKPLVQFI